MTAIEEIGFYTVIWIILFVVCLVVTYRRKNTVGLTGAFLMTFLSNHWLASALYAFPRSTLYSPSIVAAGLRLSLLGMAGFTLGVLVLAPIATRGHDHKVVTPPSPGQINRDLPRQIWVYFLIGSASLFLAALLRSRVLDVIMRESAKFAILAAFLFLYMKIRIGDRSTWIYLILIIILFASAGLIYGGFISYASVTAISLVMFYLSYSKFDLKNVIFVLLMIYIGLSALVAYLGNREEIRARIWGGQDLASRLEVVWDTAQQFEFFSIENPKHFYLMDIRLDRNYFVGRAVDNLDSGIVEYAGGQTLINAILAPIPRALWPDKPRISGSSEVFSQYTGIEENPTTSSGMGILFESYINFGSIGVVVSFALYALLLSIFDAGARRNLAAADYASAAIWLLTGYELIDPIDYLAGVAGAAVSVFIFLKIFYTFVWPVIQQRAQIPMSSKPLAGSV